jgi:hypothetical protein
MIIKIMVTSLEKSNFSVICSILFICEGFGLIISIFLPWIGHYSIYELFLFPNPYQSNYAYIFPIIAGFLLIITVCLKIFPPFKKKISSLFQTIMVIIVFNLEIYFFTVIFNEHGQFIWQYPGLYVNLLSLGGVFLTIFLTLFNFSSENREMDKSETILDKKPNEK